MQGMSWAKDIDCISPALQVSSWPIQQTARRMVIECFINESVISGFDYYRLGLDVLFGTKIRARNIEQSLREQLTPQDIMLYVENEDMIEKSEVRKNVIKAFKAVLVKQGFLQESATTKYLDKTRAEYLDITMVEYLNAVMEAFYQELKLKIDGEWEYILADLKDTLRDPNFFTAEDILGYNQAGSSIREHEIRRKVKDAAKKKLATRGVFFNKQVEDMVDNCMVELKQELFKQITQSLDKNREGLMKYLFDSLSSRQRSIYFSLEPQVQIEQGELREKTKNIFHEWLKKNDIYFEGSNWEYYYGYMLNQIMKDVVRENPNVYLRSSDSAAVFKMAEQINAGVYKNVSGITDIGIKIKEINEHINRIAKPFKPTTQAVPECNENTPVFITNAVVIGKDNYCFGFFSHDPLLKNKLKEQLGQARFAELFPAPTLILSHEILADADPGILQEYIYLVINNWQGLGSVFGAQKFFPKNYNGFIEGKDYEPNIIKDMNKPDKPIIFKADSKFQPGHIGQATKPFFGRTGMKFWEIVEQKTKRVSSFEPVDLSVEQQIESLSLAIENIFNYKPAFLIERAI